MKTKADNYFKAADLLLKEKSYNCCVALYYYSLLQNMINVLIHAKEHPISIDSLNPLNENLHNRVLEKTIDKIRPSYRNSFKETFIEIKEKRITADYEDIEISIEEALDIQQKTQSMIKKLYTYIPIQ